MPTLKLRADTTLIKGLRASVTSASEEDGWANLGAVGSLVRKQHSDFDPRNRGYAKLSDLVRATGFFTVEERPGVGMRVRHKAKAKS